MDSAPQDVQDHQVHQEPPGQSQESNSSFTEKYLLPICMFLLRALCFALMFAIAFVLYVFFSNLLSGTSCVSYMRIFLELVPLGFLIYVLTGFCFCCCSWLPKGLPDHDKRGTPNPDYVGFMGASLLPMDQGDLADAQHPLSGGMLEGLGLGPEARSSRGPQSQLQSELQQPSGALGPEALRFGASRSGAPGSGASGPEALRFGTSRSGAPGSGASGSEALGFGVSRSGAPGSGAAYQTTMHGCTPGNVPRFCTVHNPCEFHRAQFQENNCVPDLGLQCPDPGNSYHEDANVLPMSGNQDHAGEPNETPLRPHSRQSSTPPTSRGNEFFDHLNCKDVEVEDANDPHLKRKMKLFEWKWKGEGGYAQHVVSRSGVRQHSTSYVDKRFNLLDYTHEEPAGQQGPRSVGEMLEDSSYAPLQQHQHPLDMCDFGSGATGVVRGGIFQID